MRWGGWKIRVGRVWVAGLLSLSAARSSQAQTVLQQEVLAELQLMSQRAATVFVGQITAIQRHGSVVDVAFRVERSVQGFAGATFVLHEWAGSWVPGQSRYRVGQRALAFVHGASGAGFSSPVHGAEGLVPVEVRGANAPMLLNVRRVAASVVRAPGVPLPSEQESLLPLEGVLAVVYPKLAAPRTSLRLLPVDGRPRTGFRPLGVDVPGTASLAGDRNGAGLPRGARAGYAAR